MAVEDFKRRLREARGARSRAAVAELLVGHPAADFSAVDPGRIRYLEVTCAAPPPDGTLVRGVASVLGVDLLELLTDLGYWPPLSDGSSEVALAEVLARLEGRARVLQREGRRVLVELEP